MTLLITATEMEGKPLREALEGLERLEFPLGQLYFGRLAESTLFTWRI